MKNKISFIFLIAIAFIAVFSAKCFATYDFVADDDSNHSIGDLPFSTESYPYFFIAFKDSASNPGTYMYKIYYSTNPFTADSNTHIWNTSTVYQQSYMCSSSTGDWSFSSRSTARLYNSENCDTISNYISYFTSYDVLDSSGNVVFQRASQPTVETQGTLAKIVEEQETEKVMEEIVGILPIVIVVIVSLIAIRKAIQWIRQTLKQQ